MLLRIKSSLNNIFSNKCFLKFSLGTLINSFLKITDIILLIDFSFPIKPSNILYKLSKFLIKLSSSSLFINSISSLKKITNFCIFSLVRISFETKHSNIFIISCNEYISFEYNTKLSFNFVNICKVSLRRSINLFNLSLLLITS